MTKKIDDGGPVFPGKRFEQIGVDDTGGVTHPVYGEVEYTGISVRDYIAGQALAAFGAAFLASGWHNPNDYQIGVMVDGAYRTADAMLAARKAGVE